jgi:uridine monophosphate synthetase
MDVGAVLTAESDHPRAIERDGPNGKERGFKLKLHEKNPAAPLSPFFLNLRTPDNPNKGPLTPEIVELAASCMQAIAAEAGLTYDAVVGVPRAGDPFAKAFGTLAETPCLTLDKWENGDQRHVASLVGSVPAAIQNVLLMDDLVTGADSKLEATGVLRDAGILVDNIIVLVDREQGGKKQLADYGHTLHSIFTITDLLDLYVQTGRITQGLRLTIMVYLAAQS